VSAARFHDLFVASASVAVLGLLFVAASLLSLLRVRHSQPEELRDAAFLVILVSTLAGAPTRRIGDGDERDTSDDGP
jgi:hypothetical protein